MNSEIKGIIASGLFFSFLCIASCNTENSLDNKAIYLNDCFRRLGNSYIWKVTATTHVRVELTNVSNMYTGVMEDYPRETINREFIKLQCPN
jgi:hypothetical protein